MDAFSNRLMQTYPAASASYIRAARKGRCNGGSIFYWEQALPRLLFLTIRESSVGATRLRHVQAVLLLLVRDYARYNMQSLALAPLGTIYERAEILTLCEQWFSKTRLQAIVYTEYAPGVQADEQF